MDSELEERKLSSIRRPQIIFIYRKGGVDNPETFGQIVCSAGTPAQSRWAQAAQSGMCVDVGRD